MIIYWQLFYEFLTIGLLAVGGGLVTIPFLAELSEKYGWFSLDELTDMIAISEITPGTIGINMATFAGFQTGGISGGIIATLGLTLPAFIILLFFSNFIVKYKSNHIFQNILFGIRPAAIALILYAGWLIAKLSLTEWKTQLLSLVLLLLSFIIKKSPFIYIIIGAGTGIAFGL